MNRTGTAAGPWAAAAQSETYVGRWSRPVARRFLSWLAVPEGRRRLDAGCGTGALTGAVLATCAPESVLGVNPSRAFLAHATAHVHDRRAEIRQGDAQALPEADDSVDAVVSGVVLNLVPDPAAIGRDAARDAARGNRGGVRVGLRRGHAGDPAVLGCRGCVRPGRPGPGRGGALSRVRARPLRASFDEAGLADVGVEEVVVPTVFRDVDDYWTPFLGGTGPAPAYVASLADADRAALGKEIRRRLPVAADGTIRLSARAWAVRGRRQ